MYLGIGAMLSAWAHDASTNVSHRAIFSSITSVLHGAMAAQSIGAAYKSALVAQKEIGLALEQAHISTTSRSHRVA